MNITISKILEKPLLNLLKLEIFNNNIKIKNLEIEIQKNNIEKQKHLNNLNPENIDELERIEEFWNNIEKELKDKIHFIDNLNNEFLSIQAQLLNKE